MAERDLLYIPTSADEVLVVACDSDGGIGPKPQDTVPCPAHELGRFAVRVPLLEAMAVGAQVVAVVDTLSVERQTTGDEIIRGVLVETRQAGVPDHAVTGSTEDNVPTVATGVGVTVIAHAGLDELRTGSARPGDVVALVGEPRSAPVHAVTPDDPDILDVGRLRAVLAHPATREVLPIGSSGVGHEVGALAGTAGLGTVPLDPWPVDPGRSGGPSTAAVVALEAGSDPGSACRALADACGLPVWPLARLVRDDVSPVG